jgi:hypothetical protein
MSLFSKTEMANHIGHQRICPTLIWPELGSINADILRRADGEAVFLPRLLNNQGDERFSKHKPTSRYLSHVPIWIFGSEEARRKALASVRRPNCTCGSPACSFHEDTGPEM